MYVVFLDIMLLHTKRTTVWCKYSFYMHCETKKKKIVPLTLLLYSLYCPSLTLTLQYLWGIYTIPKIHQTLILE